MGLVFLVVVGGILGWIAAIIMRTDEWRGILLNLAVGSGGALATGLMAGPLLGMGNVVQGQHSVDGLLTALAGSVVLLFAVNLVSNRQLD